MVEHQILFLWLVLAHHQRQGQNQRQWSQWSQWSQ